jgi:WD40 repeat protein
VNSQPIHGLNSNSLFNVKLLIPLLKIIDTNVEHSEVNELKHIIGKIQNQFVNIQTELSQITKFNPHENGVTACAFSPDNELIGTLSSDKQNQILSLWEWNTIEEDPEPIISLKIPTVEPMKYIQFNPANRNQLMTNGNTCMVFWTFNRSSSEMSYYSPSVTSAVLKKPIGKLIYSCYLPNLSCPFGAR